MKRIEDPEEEIYNSVIGIYNCVGDPLIEKSWTSNKKWDWDKFVSTYRVTFNINGETKYYYLKEIK